MARIMIPRYLKTNDGFEYPFDEDTYVMDDMGNARRVPHILPECWYQDIDGAYGYGYAF